MSCPILLYWHLTSTFPIHTALNLRRKELVKEQQGALAQRKTLSAEIGKLMREKKVGSALSLCVCCMLEVFLMAGRLSNRLTPSPPSLSIGSQDEEATKLKTQVEYANSVAARAEEQLEQVCVLHDQGGSGVSQSVSQSVI